MTNVILEKVKFYFPSEKINVGYQTHCTHTLPVQMVFKASSAFRCVGFMEFQSVKHGYSTAIYENFITRSKSCRDHLSKQELCTRTRKENGILLFNMS